MRSTKALAALLPPRGCRAQTDHSRWTKLLKPKRMSFKRLMMRKLLGRNKVEGPMPVPRRRIQLTGLSSSYTFYAIGDVHGCIRELREADDRIAADLSRAGGKGIVILLGDYVDRGPQSAAVLDYLIEDRRPNFRRVALCGNHDEVFLSALEHPATLSAWLDFAGTQTLLSYGIDATSILRHSGRQSALTDAVLSTVPNSHINFLRQLPVSVSTGTHLFVHAGIVPGRALERQSDRDLMWIREPFLSKGPNLPIKVVHGHTASVEAEFINGRIGIDTGAYATGRLTVLKVVEGREEILR